MRTAIVSLLSIAMLSFGGAAVAQERAGRVEQVIVHGESLEGNLEGNSADRTVFVYLPPSYEANPNRRYPVVVNLHGYTSTAAANVEYLNLPASADRAIENGAAEMILVFPDAMTVHGGSMYSSSVTVGDWEAFIAEDLTAYIDANYRTIANANARGLSGHSMGGYGTFRIGMKYPDVYSALYAMSACCLDPRLPSPNDARAEAVQSVAEAQALSFFEKALFASAAAWSPNPNKPPFFMNLPTTDGVPQPTIYADYAAGALNSLLHQYVPELKQFRAIGMEIGDTDFLMNDNRRMDALLTSYGINHSFEIYVGDHVNRIPQRFEENLMPFFTEHLRAN